MCAKLLQLCLTLCNPMDCSPPGSCVYVHSVDILNKDAGELLGASLATSTSLGQILLTLQLGSQPVLGQLVLALGTHLQGISTQRYTNLSSVDKLNTLLENGNCIVRQGHSSLEEGTWI